MWRDRLLREESWAVVKCIRHNNVVVFISKLTQDLKRLNVSIFRCHSSCLHSLNNLHESVSNIMTSKTCIKFPPVPVRQLVTFLSVYLGTLYLDFIQNMRWCMWYADVSLFPFVIVMIGLELIMPGRCAFVWLMHHLGGPLAHTRQSLVIGHKQQYWAVIGCQIMLVFTDTPNENCLYRPERWQHW